MKIIRFFLPILLLGLIPLLPAGEAGSLPELAVAAEDLDLEQCSAWGDGAPLPAPASGDLLVLLGLQPAGDGFAGWSTPPLARRERYFRIAFRQPVLVGTLLTEYAAPSATVALLKEGVPYPGRIDRDEDWVPLGHGAVKTFPRPTLVRALRFTAQYSPMPWNIGLVASRLECALLLKGRFWSPAQLGGSEWTALPGSSGKSASAATLDQWTGFWPTDLTIAALASSRRPAGTTSFAVAVTGLDKHPLTAPAESWKEFPAGSGPTGPGFLSLRETLHTRAIRLQTVGSAAGASRPEIMPLVALTEKEETPVSFVPPPPCTFSYEMPQDGFLALRLAREGGADVRRLIAEVERTKGRNTEGWDLQDDQGAYVKPGTYVWRAISRPPLALTYMNTVYNAGTPPWPAPLPGAWWLADHTPPRAVAAVKDIIFIGAPGAEYGVGLIAVDGEGKKLWQRHEGVERLTSDGRYAYVVNTDSVVRIDPGQGFRQEKIFTFNNTHDLPGHAGQWILSDHGGVACHGGVMAIAYDAPGPPWIASGITGPDVDLSGCFPPPVKEKTHDTALNPEERILSALQIMPSSQQGVFGQALNDGALKNVLLLRLKREVSVGSILLPPGVQVRALHPGSKLSGAFSTHPGEQALSQESGLGIEEKGDEGGELELEEDGDGRFEESAWASLTSLTSDRPDLASGGSVLQSSVLAFTGPALRELDYALVMNRRYRNMTDKARLIFLEGKAVGPGGWTTTRGPENPISSENAPTAGLVWPQAVELRGFALIRPMPWAGVAVDVWDGPADTEVDEEAFKAPAHWRTVRIYRKADNSMKFGWHTDKVILGDLGETRMVRALRVRIIEPPRQPGSNETVFSGGFGGLVTLQPVGDKTQRSEVLNERLTLIQLPGESGKASVLGHLRVPHPGAMTFAPDGTLFLHTAEGIVKAASVLEQKEQLQFTPFIAPEACRLPRAMALVESELYVLDGESRRVKVFDTGSGKFLRALGKPYTLGPWEPSHLDVPSDMTLDSRGRLWLVDQMYQPKRISRWSRDGRCDLELLGGTNYGGGGFMDPGDRTVVNHLGMKFRLDYTAGSWKLESRFWPMNGRSAYSPDRVIRYGPHRFLVGDRSVVVPEFNDKGPNVMLAVEQEGVAVPLVTAGLVAGLLTFDSSKEIQAAFGDLDPDRNSYLWCDLNRDTVVQPGEVQIRPGQNFKKSLRVGLDLSLNFSGSRLRLQEVREDGLPLYDLTRVESIPAMDHETEVSPAGETFVMHHRFLDAAGKELWNYPDNYMSVQLGNQTPFGYTQRPAGVLCGGFSVLGSFEIAGETLFCVNGTHGDYFAFTRDGLLAAAVLGGPAGYGQRYFSGPEANPGQTDLTDLRTTVEDFRGHICRADDGQVYAIAGKSDITIVRVEGLEKMQRLAGGTVVVTNEDIEKTMVWAAEKARIEAALRRPALCTVPYMKKKPKIDGITYTDWPTTPALEIRTVRDARGQVSQSWQARIAFDEENLYVAATASDVSGAKNSAEDRQRLFQYGDGVDLNLGLSPAADPNRPLPGPGDIRLVIAPLDGAPVAMLYRYRVEGKRLGGEAVKFTSPVGELAIDEVVEVSSARIVFIETAQGWACEAEIPWSALGGEGVSASCALRGDIGILISDPDGMRTVTRFYWSNRSTVVMSDLPGEARILPALWGEMRFVVPDLMEMDSTGDRDLLDGILQEEEE